MEPLRLVLVGKTGAGKSTLGNALTGLKEVKINYAKERDRLRTKNDDVKQGFKVGRGMSSETVYCDRRKAHRLGTVLEVIDTPGLCDTELPEEVIHKELAKSIALANPGPHAVIFVAKCNRFTKEERDAYNTIKQLFSEDVNNHLILVFTALDNFKADEESLEELREILAEEIGKLGEPAHSMMRDAGHRYLGVSLKGAEKEDLDRQVRDLIDMIKDLVRKNGPRAVYSSELTNVVREKVEELARQRAQRAMPQHAGLPQQMASPQQPQEDQDGLKDDIATENVEPGFFASLASAVAEGCRRVKEGVKKMCTVM